LRKKEHVCCVGRRDKEGKTLAPSYKHSEQEAAFIRADVRSEDDVRNLVDQTVKRFGRLDVAVNNAATEGTPGLSRNKPPKASPHLRHQCARHSAEHEA